jgi:carbonic anhydrase
MGGEAPVHGAGTPASATHVAVEGRDPEQAWASLVEGNRRFVADRPKHGRRHAKRMAQLASGQAPFAVIVGCSDSRVPPEVVFDQDLGDVFVIRTAGHVVDDVALGSIEYAVAHLGSRLLVVLGHERCGAVAAAVEGGVPHDHVASLVEAIAPAVERTKGRPGDAAENAMLAHVEDVVQQLRAAPPVLADGVTTGRVAVRGARYDLDTGHVTLVTGAGK